MGAGMDEHTKTNDNEIGELSAKEQVLKIYPTALAYRSRHDGMNIIAILIKKDTCWGSFDIHSASGYTEDRAWKNAWNNIQVTMLKKLESCK